MVLSFNFKLKVLFSNVDIIHEVKEDEGWTGEKSSIIEDKEEVARKEAKVE